MNVNRREFLGLLGTGAAAAALPGCVCPPAPAAAKKGKIALQLYSIRGYVERVGFDRALDDIAAIGYKAVEFGGYYNYKGDPKGLRRALANAGLKACGKHVSNDAYGFDSKKRGFDTAHWTYDADALKRTCELNMAYGNNLVVCAGGGNLPPKTDWHAGEPYVKPTPQMDEFFKRLVEFYNRAAVDAAKFGCRIGLHNHQWEHGVFLSNGQSFWDYFFSNTDPAVCIEQDIGWSTCAGVDPCATYERYPHRSPSLHAKENGMGPGVTSFDGILGKPGLPGAKPVEWDRVIAAAEKDGVEWFIVECERHDEDLSAILPSYAFLKSKGLQ